MTGLRPRFAAFAPLVGAVLLSGAGSAAGVVGGAPTPRATYPFFVEVGSGCGGALVAPDRVLTAAHCLEVVGERRVVRVGPGRVQRAVRRLAIHPVAVVARRRAQREFPPQPPDLMLLELASPVTGVAPVALASAADDATAPGAELVTIGVGASRKDGTGRGPFRSGVVAVQDASRRCADQLPTARERAWSLCTRDPRVDRPAAGAPPFVSACFGDSGGPLVQVRDGVPRLVGVVSWGPSCGTERDPEVYADVTRAAAFAGSARPVWAPLAAGPPTLVGTPRVGGLLACRVRWVQAPTRVTVTFAVDGRVRQSTGRHTYRVRPEDRGHPVVCDAAGATAGGPGGTRLSAPRVVG